MTKLRTEYQDQTWPVRAYRWCRWKLPATVAAFFRTVWWLTVGGAEPIAECDRQYTMRLIWIEAWAIADHRMGNCFDIKDLIEELREKIKAKEQQ